MRAEQIVDLIAAKHHKDVVVTECKTGPTHGSQMQRMDVWVMATSWVNPCCTAYEVKVSRSDFTNDAKWRGYLPFCNEFYFACPWGMIQKEELSDGVGLLWASKTGSRLYMKRKAAHRDIPIPEELYRYILMARCQISREWQKETDKDYWAGWLKGREIDYQLGRRVSKALREKIHERITVVESKNETLNRENKSLAEAKELLAELGIDYLSIYGSRDRIERALAKIRGGTLVAQIDKTVQALADAKTTIGGTGLLRESRRAQN